MWTLRRVPLKSAIRDADTSSRIGEPAVPGDKSGGVTTANRETAQLFSIRRTGGTVIITVHGDIGFDDWCRIDPLLRDLIDAQGNLDVVLDLCELVHLGGDAVHLIVDAAHQAHSHGGRLRLADRACRARLRGRSEAEV